MEQSLERNVHPAPDTSPPELWLAITEMARLETRLYRSQEQWATTMLRVANFRDDETPEHIQRMSRYTGVIARSISSDSQWASRVALASQLHDIGKIGIPDDILLKIGPLTQDEKEDMQQHTLFGCDILSASDSEPAEMAASIALRHHERWDGMGYPDGLGGEEIPIEARMAAIADTFDALTTNRIYRKAYPLPRAVRIMREERGRQFDPDLLDEFLGALDQVMHIFKSYPDVPSPRASVHRNSTKN